MADAGREVRPGLKTLFITGYAESAALGNSSLGGGMQVLTKPFSIDILARVLELTRLALAACHRQLNKRINGHSLSLCSRVAGRTARSPFPDLLARVE